MLTILATATSERLTTLANVKEALEVDGDADDSFLTRLIDRASARVARHLGYPPLLQRYQEILPSYGGVDLALAYPRVRRVIRLFDGTDTGTAASLTSTEYRLDGARGFLNRDLGWEWTAQYQQDVARSVVPGGEFKNWLVEYSAGWVGPTGTTSTADGATSTGRTLPEDVEEACILLVKASYLSRRRDPSVTSRRVGELAITYRDTAMPALGDEVGELLAPFRSMG